MESEGISRRLVTMQRSAPSLKKHRLRFERLSGKTAMVGGAAPSSFSHCQNRFHVIKLPASKEIRLRILILLGLLCGLSSAATTNRRSLRRVDGTLVS
jgi:hypothetical protein